MFFTLFSGMRISLVTKKRKKIEAGRGDDVDDNGDDRDDNDNNNLHRLYGDIFLIKELSKAQAPPLKRVCFTLAEIDIF